MNETKEKMLHLEIAVEEAIELIEQAQQLIDNALNGMGIEDNYRAYGRYGFDQLLGNGNKYDNCLLDLINEENED